MPSFPDISGKFSQSRQRSFSLRRVWYLGRMSLRLRVVVLIGTVLLISMLLGTMVAGYQARHALNAELAAGLTGAEQTVKSAFEDLPHSDHQARDLRQLVATFDGNRHVRAALLNTRGQAIQTSYTDGPPNKAPGWFHALLRPDAKAVQVRTPGSLRGAFVILLTPTAALDIGDAWNEFIGVALVMTASALIGLFLVYVVIGAAFRPLRNLAVEFSRIGTGDYSGRVAEAGPLELLSLQRGFNEMAGQLGGATARNRLLTDQLLTIQDEERADIARDLHDEIGPHLFGVNMDAEMIAQLNGAGRQDAIPDQVRSIQTAVAHMQRQVRDLLDRLRPTRVTEFGLNAAIADLAKFWLARRPDIAFELNLFEEEERLPDTTKEVIYRVVQEAANNAVRHGNPKTVCIDVQLGDRGDLEVRVLDDGGEPARPRNSGGLGLIGMRERVAALGGALATGRSAGGEGWSVLARLPLDRAARAVPMLEASL